MKLHLPVSLFKMLLVVMGVAHMTSEAALMSSDATLVTYTDFGQNMGRYKTNDSANELLLYLRQQAGGVVLTYEGGQADILLPHEMPDFSRTSANASYAVYGYNATISVQHMPTVSGSMTTANLLGQDKSIQYKGIEYATDGNETFLHSPGGGYTFAGQNAGKGVDHKVTRLSKVVTDVESAPLFSGTGAEMLEYLRTDGGQMIYRNGAGSQSVKEDGITEGLISAGNYVTGGVDRVDSGNTIGLTYNGVGQVFQNTMNGAGENEPLPYVGTDGDSGSPVYVYHNGQYELVGSTAWTDHVTFGKSFAAIDYDREKLAQYDKVVTTGAAKVTLGAVSHESEQDISSDQVASWSVDPSEVSRTTFQTVETTPFSGTVKVGAQTLLQFVGVQDGVHTWKSLAREIDKDNWYHYGNEYLNAAHFTTAEKDLTFADLFVTENLVFRGSAATTTVELDATVDLGIGYARFSADGACKNYVIQSAEGSNHQFNHAGYVIDEGVAVHSRLTGDASHVYEWRKVGDGDLYIEGTGVNKVLLNVGGKGKTYLHREQVGNDEYYAAYNVLASTGATVEIADINQIKRDFTFGNKGGVLDMHGNSMVWNNDNGADAEGFTIHALDEQAVVANLKQGSESVLTWTQSGDQTFLGSFQDNGKGSILQFVYDGGKESSLMLHSIRTRLNTPGSGMVVKSGSLVLAGTHTVHGMGSATGTSTARYENELDWHYADATSNVTVENGAAFELGSHARLTGDITVKAGGSFVMREGVQHEQEYIEGGQRLESTSAIADYYGLKGDVSLEKGATMKVRFSSGTTATNTYTGHITGTGNVEVDAASAVLKLTGTNTFSGTKTLIRGGLLGSSLAAFGDTGTNKWLVEDEGWIASQTGSAADLLAKVHTSSTGTLALSSDTATQLQLAGYTGLYLGAEQGKTVNYGTMGTGEALQAVDGAWRLGGGGGTLVVHYLLSGDNNLLLGADEGSQGTVHLTNTSNSFTGSIQFNGEGIILTYDEGALGQSVTNLSYGNSVVLEGADGVRLLDVRSEGMAMVDKIASSTVNLSSHANLSLGAGINTTFTGDILLAEGQAYRFGAASGVTFNVQTELQSGHDVVIDSQGTSGGKVVLLTPSRLTDSLSVLGKAGSVALELAQDVELSGTLTVDSTASLKGRNVVVSSDSGLVELSGSMSYDSFTLKDGGTLNIRSGAQLDAAHALVVDNGNLNLNQQNLTTKVELKNGGKVNGSASQISAGAEILATQGTGIIDAGTDVKVYGQIGAEKDATLQLSGNLVELYASSVNTSGGTLDVQCSTLSLERVDRIGGTLSIGTDVELNTSLYNAQQSPAHVNHTIDALDIRDGYQLKINQTSTSNVHVWNIASLTGTGELYWIAAPYTYVAGASRMILSGGNSFEGKIRLMQRSPNASWGWAEGASFLQHLELAHDEAASGAVISLEAAPEGGALASYNRPALAINTQNAQIRGIEGWENSKIFAGPAPTNRTLDRDNLSSALNTLTITGSGEYRYAGQIQGTEQFGLNIVMNGTGKQIFSNQWSTVHDITALQGALVFEAAPANLHGDVSIAQGAELTLGSGAYTLNSGHTLNVLAGTPGEQAVLNNALVLNGGSLVFDAQSLSSDYPAFLLQNGVSRNGTSNISIGFTHIDDLVAGNTYTLASGNWSGLVGSLSVDGMSFYKTTFGTNDDGYLQMQLKMADGYTMWEGNGNVLQPGAKVVFLGRTEEQSTVFVEGASKADTGIFVNKGEFSISGAEGASLSFSSIEKSESGALVIDTEVRAETMQVKNDSVLSGAGTLSVGTLNAADGSVVKVQALDVTVGSLNCGSLHLADGASLTTSQTSINSSLKLGEAGVTSRVELGIGGGALSLGGSVDIESGTSLSVKGNGKLTFNPAFNNLASLELQKGVNMEQNSAISTHLVLDGGWASAKGGDILRGDITVKNSGTFTFTGGDDILRYAQDGKSYGKTITVSGGTLAFGNTRQTMASWNLVLSDGATVTGSGGSYDINGKTRQAALDFNSNDSTIYATSGESTISAITRLRNGNNLNYNVSKDATLTVSGLIHADGAAGKGSITKEGEGTLVLTGANTYADTTTVNGGTLATSTDGALGTSAVVINGGVLELAPAGGEKVNASILKGDVTVNNGGTLRIGGNDNKVVDTNVTINAGGRMEFTGSGSDMIDYTNGKSKTITVNGGVIDFGTTRQTIGERKLVLSDNATITGVGNATYGAMDFNLTNATISVTSGKNNTISAVTRLRGTESDVNLNYDVDTDAVLTVSGRIHADGASDRGSITKKGQGELVLSVANAHAGTTTVSEGTLRVTSTGSLGSSAVKVNSGATLVLEASSGSSSAVQLDKVTLDSGAALELQGGTYSLNGNLGSAGGKIVLGIDALSTNEAHRSLNGLVEVTSDITVTGGEDKRLDVAQGAELRLCDGASMHRADESSYHIKGSLSTAKNAENVRFTSVDDIHLNYDNNGATGSIDVAEGSDLTLSVNKLQSYASAAINVGEDARLDMSDTNNITLSKDTTVNLQSGATLALKHLEFSNKADSGTATLKSGGDAYGLDKANYELRNGHMAFNATSQATVKLKLTQSSVENSCGYLLTLDNAGNTLTGVHATKGNITVQNVDQLDLKKLEIAANKTITAANVVVSELAKLESGATLTGNLTLASGAVVDLGDKVTLNGVLTLQSGLTLSDTMLDEIKGLAAGASYTLFTGVSELKVEQAITLYNMRSLAEETLDAVSNAAQMNDMQVAAGDYFSNLDGNTELVLSYNSTAGTVTITNTQAVPEPATATLSLLALAALCARRKRR